MREGLYYIWTGLYSIDGWGERDSSFCCIPISLPPRARLSLGTLGHQYKYTAFIPHGLFPYGENVLSVLVRDYVRYCRF